MMASQNMPREDYIALYVDTVRQAATAEDPSRDFMVSRCQELQELFMIILPFPQPV
jgi:hypothetical protein